MYSSYLLICSTKLFVLYCGTIVVTELSECAFRIFLKKYKKQWKQRRRVCLSHSDNQSNDKITENSKKEYSTWLQRLCTYLN